MSALFLPSPVTSCVKTQRAATSAPAPEDTACSQMERPAKIWMSVQPSSITASSSVSTPSEASPASVLLASPSTRLPVSITTSVQVRAVCVVHRPLASTHLVASTVNALKVSPWTPQDWSVRMWMSVAVTTAASTAVRTCWEVSAAVVLRATCSITSGTSVWMRMSVRQEQCVALLPATTHWAATSVCVPLALTLSRALVAAKM